MAISADPSHTLSTTGAEPASWAASQQANDLEALTSIHLLSGKTKQ